VSVASKQTELRTSTMAEPMSSCVGLGGYW
jgi:hypothetical protein